MERIGNLNSTLQTALSSIQRELKSAAENAEKIAGATSIENPERDIVSPIIDLKENLRQVTALRKVINITDEMQDEVLNIIA